MEDPGHNESRLLAAVRASDVASFRVLFERYQPVLFRSLVGRLRDADLAHDIVQETFVRVWERRAKLRPGLPLYPYLHKISGNLARDHLKHAAVRAKHAGTAGEALGQTTPGPDEVLEARALESEILNIVNMELGEKCRMVFLLSRMEGKTNAEIAGMLGLSRKTVENQLTRALKVLRRRLPGG